MAALAHFFQTVFHIIAQIIKAEFIICAVSYITVISGLTLIPIGFVVIDTADCHAQEIIDLPHPFCVATR